MWQIFYTVAGGKKVHVETAASEAEMLSAVKTKYHGPEFFVEHVEGPEGKKLDAAQVGLFTMLLNTKASAQPGAALKRMLSGSKRADSQPPWRAWLQSKQRRPNPPSK